MKTINLILTSSGQGWSAAVLRDGQPIHSYQANSYARPVEAFQAACAMLRETIAAEKAERVLPDGKP
jgi:hypothetical protein